MKSLKLIATLSVIAVSFTANAQNYQVQNKPALIVNSQAVKPASVVYSQPQRIEKRYVDHTPTHVVYHQPQRIEQRYVDHTPTQVVYSQPQRIEQPVYVQRDSYYDEPELSYAVRSQYQSGHRGDILGEVVEVKRAPKQCEPTVKHEGANTVLGAVVGGALGNQIGGGSGRDVATVAGVLLGGSVANKNNRENRGKVKCEGRGYLLTLAYVDEYGQVRYHTVRSDRRESKGTLLNIER